MSWLLGAVWVCYCAGCLCCCGWRLFGLLMIVFAGLDLICCFGFCSGFCLVCVRLFGLMIVGSWGGGLLLFARWFRGG